MNVKILAKMKQPSILAFSVLQALVSTITASHYAITTVYKFNFIEEADENGAIVTSYFNTCSVTVHPQFNAVGLPYYNINSNGTPSIIYPLRSPTIPPLQNWKTYMSENQDIPLEWCPIKESERFEKIPRGNIFYNLDKYGTELMSTKRSLQYNEIIFNPDELSMLNINSNTFLRVRSKYIEDVNITLKRNSVKFLVLKIHQGNRIEICLHQSESCQEYVYQSSDYYVYNICVSLKGKIVFLDCNSGKIISISNENCDRITAIVTEKHYRTLFTLIQVPEFALLDDRTIFSPWIPQLKNGSSMFYTSYRKSGSKVSVQVRDRTTNEDLALESEDQIIANTGSDYVLTLTKVDVVFPQDWIQDKQIRITADAECFIRDVWEAGHGDIYQIHGAKPCEKQNIKEVYDVTFIDPKQNRTIANCYNGGIPDHHKETCVCPPGFTGDTCEIACGRNSYGQKCSKLCSTTGYNCKGTILCTPDYGCSCAPGYRGNQCLEPCGEGTYGADCKQTCGQCKDGCDKYTGHCRGECSTPYLVRPSCKNTTPYWNKAPEIVDSSSTSIKLSLDFSVSNIEKTVDNTRFYMVQYKEANENVSWINGSYETFSSTHIEYVVEQLKPGIKYFFRVLLFDETFKSNDPQYSRVSEGLTKCSFGYIENNLNVTKVTNDSITLVWNKEEKNGDVNECRFESYILDIEGSLDGLVETRKIRNIKRNTFVVKPLTPGFLYDIKLKKFTIHGESPPVSEIQVTTDKAHHTSVEVPGVTLKKMGSEIFVQWFKSSLFKTYYVKYKLTKLLSCGDDELQSPFQIVSALNTNYTLSLKPYGLYQIFVTSNENQTSSSNMRTEVTDGKLPDIAPSLLKQKLRVSDNKVQIYWLDPPSSCNQMNGLFRKYALELLDNHDTILHTYETKDKYIEIIGLVPKTYYKVRIRYVNHVGTNNRIYEEYSFITRATSFFTVLDLTAYKASATLIGIRWKMPTNNSTITGIYVKVKNHSISKSFNITDPSNMQCKAWLSHVCYNIEHLKPNTKYNVSVEILSEEFPEGGSPQSIEVVTRESVTDPVTDIKVVEISNTNVTISWRIPFFLNGILRKFLVEVEHLSSFDESLCCQSITTINHLVTEEIAIYTHVIENIQNTSSYQVTIRALTKRLGQEARKIIDIPPPIIPLRFKPRVTVDDVEVVWEDQGFINSTAGTELAEHILVIVVEDENTESTVKISLFKSELSQHLKSNNWWLAHECPVSEVNCSTEIGTEETEPHASYGEINNKPLSPGQNYTIALVQVNRYLSARSFTIVKSLPIQKKGSSTVGETEKSFGETTQDPYVTVLEYADELRTDI